MCRSLEDLVEDEQLRKGDLLRGRGFLHTFQRVSVFPCVLNDVHGLLTPSLHANDLWAFSTNYSPLFSLYESHEVKQPKQMLRQGCVARVEPSTIYGIHHPPIADISGTLRRHKVVAVVKR